MNYISTPAVGNHVPSEKIEVQDEAEECEQPASIMEEKPLSIDPESAAALKGLSDDEEEEDSFSYTKSFLFN